jgi:hypothetical protein
MISERKLRRFQLGLLVAAGVLFGCYWFGYRSLGAWARDLDKPTAEAWKKLVAAAQVNAQVRSLDAAVLQADVQQMRQAATLLQQTAKAASAHAVLDEETRAHLGQDFQLLDFDQARLQVGTELRRAAEAQKVTLTDAALKGLPEFDPELPRPALHWAQLAFARQLLAVTIAVQPRAISNLSMLPVKTHVPGDGRPVVLVELPMRLEVAGPPANLVALLSGLPLRGGEFKAAGLPEVAGKTQALFVDRLILKKSQPIPDEAVLEIVVVGFCEHSKPEVVR